MKKDAAVEADEMSSIDGKPGRGRPVKTDALTPAERSRRYREKQKRKRTADKAKHQGHPVIDTTVDILLEQLRKLQMKYDLEHLTVIQLKTELANFKLTSKQPAENPLARQVTALKQTVSEQERIISAYSAEINSLRDALKLSQKNPVQQLQP